MCSVLTGTNCASRQRNVRLVQFITGTACKSLVNRGITAVLTCPMNSIPNFLWFRDFFSNEARISHRLQLGEMMPLA
jgi:hypothetical protein